MTSDEFDEILEQTNAVICNREWYERAIKALEQEPKTIPIGVYEQVQWERDIAISQLKELGYGLGEKPRVDEKPILDKIRAEINSPNRGTCDYFIVDRIEEIIDKYTEKSEPQGSDIEKRKPCSNCEDGCEEWAGCPCVHYKAESEDKE